MSLQRGKLATTIGLVLAAYVVLVTSPMVKAQGDCGSLVNMTAVDDPVYLFVGQEANISFTIWEVFSDGVLTFESTSDFHFSLTSRDTEHRLTTSDMLPINITVTIQGKAISLKNLAAKFRFDSGGTTVDPVEVASTVVGVKRIPTLLSALTVYIIIVWVILSYISMGGAMEFKEIWEKVRRPYGVVIGLFCQFIIMPAMTFLIANLLAAEDNATAVGIVLVGTTPGGWLSNILTVLIDGDMVLSITMTFFSNVIALFMMPFNLFIYATPFTGSNERLRTPFIDIIIQLAILVIPLFIGIGITIKFKKFGRFCQKIIKPIASLLIIIAIALIIPAELYAFTESPVKNWVASILIPALGAFFGLAFARIFARNIRTSVTIAIETGVQNALLGRTIVFLSYPQPEADLLTRIILTVVFITLLEGLFAVSIFSCFRYVLCKGRCDATKKEASDDTNMNDNNDNGTNRSEQTGGEHNKGFDLEIAQPL